MLREPRPLNEDSEAVVLKFGNEMERQTNERFDIELPAIFKARKAERKRNEE